MDWMSRVDPQKWDPIPKFRTRNPWQLTSRNFTISIVSSPSFIFLFFVWRAMTSLLLSPPRTLPPLYFSPLPKSLHLSPRRQIQTQAQAQSRTESQSTASTSESERGVEFSTGDLFYRRESATGRDLAVLSSAISQRRLGGGIRVLDAMCGCGVRSVRYLSQGGAEFVWANDAFEGCRPQILANLSSVAPRFSR